MNIPEQAVDAAIIAILEPGNPSNRHIREISNYRQQVQAALEAALPEIEKAIRSEWADYIDAATITVGNTLTLESLADILRQPGRPFGTEKGNQK